MSGRFQLAVIIGSTREGRLGTTVAAAFAKQVSARGDFALELIDLAELARPPAH